MRGVRVREADLQHKTAYVCILLQFAADAYELCLQKVTSKPQKRLSTVTEHRLSSYKNETHHTCLVTARARWHGLGLFIICVA